MMKKLVSFASASAGLILVFLAVRFVAAEIEKRQRINTGNVIIGCLESYRQNQGALPDSYDWKVLQTLGFGMTNLGTQPAYKKKSASSYELVFLEGFDGPYLTYESSMDKWVIK